MKTDETVTIQYETTSARLADAGFQLWNTGVLLQATQQDVQYAQKLTAPTLKDEYTFIRRYWGTPWATYTLLLRLLTFKNPFTEIRQYLVTRQVTKIDIFNSPVVYDTYNNFKSPLLHSQPLITVIIPTLNRYPYLKNVLHDLEKQTYQNIEVIIIDQSDDFQQQFYNSFHLNINLIHQKEKKLWTARNKAVEKSKGDYLLFFDDDSRVEPDWIKQHVKCLDYFGADISAGVSLSAIGGKIPDNYSYFRWADQFDSGNALVRKEVFYKIGLFDEQFNGMRMGDGEFGIRAYMNGFKSISNHKAFRIHLKAGSGGLREMSGWDAFRTNKWLAPKPVPSAVYLYKKYFPEPLFRNAILLGMLLSNIPYKHKRSSKMLVLSILLSLIKAPLLYYQFKRSEKIADLMLHKDDGIRMPQKSVAQQTKVVVNN